MALLSGFGVTLGEVGLLGQAAMAAFAGGAIPVGWSVVSPQQLGVAPPFQDGIYFTNSGASAIVLQQGANVDSIVHITAITVARAMKLGSTPSAPAK